MKKIYPFTIAGFLLLVAIVVDDWLFTLAEALMVAGVIYILTAGKHKE